MLESRGQCTERSGLIRLLFIHVSGIEDNEAVHCDKNNCDKAEIIILFVSND